MNLDCTKTGIFSLTPLVAGKRLHNAAEVQITAPIGMVWQGPDHRTYTYTQTGNTIGPHRARWGRPCGW